MVESLRQMNAIARGVMARYERVMVNTKVITQTTIGIARKLGISEREIQRWSTMQGNALDKRKKQPSLR